MGNLLQEHRSLKLTYAHKDVPQGNDITRRHAEMGRRNCEVLHSVLIKVPAMRALINQWTERKTGPAETLMEKFAVWLF